MPANPHYSLLRQEWGQSLGKEKEGRGMFYDLFLGFFGGYSSLCPNHSIFALLLGYSHLLFPFLTQR